MMANQIGKFFVYQGSEDEAVAGIADHIRKFWDPRMRLAAFALLREGGDGLEELPRRALEKLSDEHALTTTRYEEIGTARTSPDVGDVTEA
jgi:formate dehydrogenase subunit delta